MASPAEMHSISTALLLKNVNGEVVINLGGEAGQENHLDIYPGWNATLRIYNPKPAYFDGSWVRPELQSN